jgi:UDP-N-acetylmuramoyl-L-alanyl-D-glutamate--2,6-diaminopimelate ligase
MIGTLGARYYAERKLVLLPTARTTPESCELQAELALMRDAGVKAVAMEVSSHALSLHRVDGIHFKLALFTNLSQDHLDFHHTMDEYFLAKSKLFTSNFSECALINIDDSYGKQLFANCDISSVSISTSVGDWQLSLSDLQLTSPSGKHHIFDSPLVGDFNQMNAAMALVAFAQTGGDMEEGIELLRRFPGVPGRLEQVGTGSPLVLVDYAHTPDAVTRVLASLRSHTRGRIIAVLGCGGDRDPLKRPEMGRALQAGADLAIATSDNPRSEDPVAILAAMCGENFNGLQILDRREAISYAISQATDVDLVLIAGKGHEQGQEVDGVITPFDDREVALEMLAKRGRS